MKRLLLCVACLLMFCAPAHAQLPTGIPGITVTGRATLRAQADVMYFTVQVASQTPQVSSAVTRDFTSAGTAIVGSLHQAGIQDAQAAYPSSIGTSGYQTAYVSGSIPHPSSGDVQRITSAVTVALVPISGISMQRINVNYGLLDCTRVEQQLQTIALADARARAERIAGAAGAVLGRPTSIAPGILPGYQFPCDAQHSTLVQMNQSEGLPMDGMVTFGLHINVTYAIH